MQIRNEKYPEAVMIHLLPGIYVSDSFCVLLSVLFAESLYFRICEIIPQIVFSDGSFSEPAFIFLQPLFDLSVNALAVQLILVQQCNCRAGLSEYILYTDAQYRSSVLSQKVSRKLLHQVRR